MKKIILGVFVVVILLVAGWLTLPLFYDVEVNEALPGVDSVVPAASSVGPTETPRPVAGTDVAAPSVPSTQEVSVAEPQVLGEGSFTGFDRFHQASGTARLLEVDGKTYVRFESDFTVTNGPDLFVYFGRDGEYDGDTNIGRLKGNKGSQNYEVPESIDTSDYDEVWVWCRAFAVPFGKAVLQ